LAALRLMSRSCPCDLASAGGCRGGGLGMGGCRRGAAVAGHGRRTWLLLASLPAGCGGCGRWSLRCFNGRVPGCCSLEINVGNPCLSRPWWCIGVPSQSCSIDFVGAGCGGTFFVSSSLLEALAVEPHSYTYGFRLSGRNPSSGFSGGRWRRLRCDLLGGII
jgi:hypothetical protein